MPFDWMHSERADIFRNRFTDMHVREVTERARLLKNLGYSEKDAVARIKARVEWEFDKDITSTPRPKFYSQIKKLVSGVYKR